MTWGGRDHTFLPPGSPWPERQEDSLGAGLGQTWDCRRGRARSDQEQMPVRPCRLLRLLVIPAAAVTDRRPGRAPAAELEGRHLVQGRFPPTVGIENPCAPLFFRVV